MKKVIGTEPDICKKLQFEPVKGSRVFSFFYSNIVYSKIAKKVAHYL